MHGIVLFILGYIVWRMAWREIAQLHAPPAPPPTAEETRRRREEYARYQRAYALAHQPPERPPFSAQDVRVCVVVGVLFVGLLMVCSYAGHGHFWPINLR